MPLEAQSKGSIIVTTQKPITFPWVENIGFISVEAMSRDEAGRLLFSYLERDPRNLEEEESARELADYVGGLPLAIATIGGYLRQSETSVADFSKSVQYSSSLWTESSRVSGPASYERNLESVFNKAFKELSPPARSMLNILAFLNPDSIPEALFLNGIKAGILPFLKSKADLEKCRFELRQRQLVRRDTTGPDPFISIHRTVQWNVLLQLSEDKNHRWDVFKLAFELVRKMLPESSPLAVPEAENWPAYAVYGRQILELRTHCLWPEPPVELPVDFAQVLSDMGVYMWHSGKFPEGEKALGTAENILDDNNAPLSHPLRSNIYVVLGILSSFEGVSQRKYSFELRKKAYESRHASLDGVPKMKLTLEDEMRLWNVESDLAFGWVQQEDFEEAATIMEKCLEQYKIWDTEDKIPFEYSKYYQIMSFYHMARNDPIKAIHTITHCHKMMTQAANADHPMTQLINFCYANLIWHASEPVKALEINKVVLEHRKKILGEFSHFTLESYSTCGKLCEEAGELDNAR
jgi:tetratricopeptide (TPR) repeat protein